MITKWNGDQLTTQIRRAAMTGIVRGTERVLASAVRSILTGPKSGVLYQRRGVVHQASAAGESPASDTGRLAQSGRTEFNAAELSGTVVFSTLYAPHLELGTEKMEPRPYLRPALAINMASIQADVAGEVVKVLGNPAAGAMG